MLHCEKKSSKQLKDRTMNYLPAPRRARAAAFAEPAYAREFANQLLLLSLLSVALILSAGAAWLHVT